MLWMAWVMISSSTLPGVKRTSLSQHHIAHKHPSHSIIQHNIAHGQHDTSYHSTQTASHSMDVHRYAMAKGSKVLHRPMRVEGIAAPSALLPIQAPTSSLLCCAVLAQHLQLAHPLGLYSDRLFQPWFCASQPMREEWLQLDNVARASNISVEDFKTRFEYVPQSIYSIHTAL
jgi:hypothetical protein